MNEFHGVITDAQLAELRERNEQRRQVAIAELGSRWMCHKSQHVVRFDMRRRIGAFVTTAI